MTEYHVDRMRQSDFRSNLQLRTVLNGDFPENKDDYIEELENYLDRNDIQYNHVGLSKGKGPTKQALKRVAKKRELLGFTIDVEVGYLIHKHEIDSIFEKQKSMMSHFGIDEQYMFGREI